LIKKVRKIGRATLYTINKENYTAKSMIEMYDNIVTGTLTGRAEKMRKTRVKA